MKRIEREREGGEGEGKKVKEGKNGIRELTMISLQSCT